MIDTEFANTIKKLVQSLDREKFGQGKITVEVNNDFIGLHISVDKRSGWEQVIFVYKSEEVALFVAPLPPGYESKSELPKRLHNALMKRNNNSFFKVAKWIVDERPMMVCFSCIAEIPINSLIMMNNDDSDFFDTIMYSLIQECYWFYNNYESLARQLRVFLCHANEDKAKTRELNRNLQDEGIDVWFDEENLDGGKEWRLEIPSQIRDSHVVLVLLSKKSVTKAGYVQKEIRLALDVAEEQPEGSIFLIPVRLEECEVPQRLAHYHWVDLFKGGGYEKLVKALSTRAESLGFSLSEARKSQETKNKVNNDNVIVDEKTGTDFHESAIKDICEKYSGEEINEEVCSEIIDHLRLTHRPARATHAIIAKLPLTSRIEIAANLVVIQEEQLRSNNEVSDDIESCITVFENYDKVIKKFIRYRPPIEERQRRFQRIKSDMELLASFLTNRKKSSESSEDKNELMKRLLDKTIYSHQTLFEFIFLRQGDKTIQNDDGMMAFLATVNSFLRSVILVDLNQSNGFSELLQNIRQAEIKNRMKSAEVKGDLDKHEKAIYEICEKYSDTEKIDDNASANIVNHLALIQEPDWAVRTIVNHLSIQFRVEIIVNLIWLSQFQQHTTGSPSNEVINCLTTFQRSDPVLGKYVYNRLPQTETTKRGGKILDDLEYYKDSIRGKDSISEEEADKLTEQMLSEEDVYSYQTLLEIKLMRKRAWMEESEEAVKFFDGMISFLELGISILIE